MLIRLLFISVFTAAILSCHKDTDGSPDPNPPNDTIPDPPDTATQPVELTTRVLADNLAFPWDIFVGSDGFIWMTEKSGRISRVNAGTGEVIPLLTIDEVLLRGEGGLLGMVLREDGGTSHLFVAYNYEDGADYKQKVVRYTYANNALTDPTLIHDDVAGAGIHNGCRLVIRNDKLFISTGDASDESLPQNFNSPNGKILRLNLDGSIPSDNPDPSSPVWSMGHRNPQGLVFVHDSLYSSEHGPDRDDEVNMIHRGGNYGWPDVNGVCEGSEQDFCDEHNVVEPLINWTPTIAVSGIEFYNEDEIPQWKNSLLVCTLKDETLYQLKLNDEGTGITGSDTFFRSQFGRLRDVCAAPNGKVYICTSNGTNDKLIEVAWEGE